MLGACGASHELINEKCDVPRPIAIPIDEPRTVVKLTLDGLRYAVDDTGEVTKLHRFPKEGAHVAYHDGGLFVTSRTGFVIWRFDLESGEVEIVAGNGEPGDADGRGVESSFGSPNAIVVGPDGHLYINHADGPTGAVPATIRRIRYDPVG